VLGFWEKKFQPQGITCLELTGDSEITDMTALHRADLILVTPEKLISVLR
jgi:ATP-dependent DNA helicase HFM1/MER3